MTKKILFLILGALSFIVLNAEGHGDDDKHASHGEHSSSHGGEHSHESAAGKPGSPYKVNRIIKVTMNDSMRFVPDQITVKPNEIIRFSVKNDGKITHEMVIGTMDELKEHAEMMRQMPNMDHEDPNAVSVEAGKSGALIWQFNESGTVDFACLIPGHMEAGMKGQIKIAAE
ncbi:cupredoxin family protein [Candidatus Nitrosacidococcus sp. I8]|uniref:cupredoxin domain-containing protein n=1 Tax=Candidatus Nitrosacidococcus sp. I8 TaxID=2942908 RepID=UPI0022261945|nr:cupredoxin family protein [Candidatus Nitrosacidococcus sp. I8]CAH9018873.1 hypothetical protein NURINAE_01190 [Candidatus Nitrosacidococcus sp. I8]